jgi:lipopolysaccharide assembly outer membrane protein LptD (OstA)
VNPPSFPIRRLVLAVALVMTLGSTREASAQGTGPLTNCKVGGKIEYIGPGGGGAEQGNASGEVVIVCDGTKIFAQKVTWTPTTITAEGELLVTQDGLRVNADRMEMDRKTKLGTFFNAYGTARLTDSKADKSMFGTMEPEIWFQAERIERMGPRTYKLTNGVFSTCVQPNPRWEMRGTTGTVILDDHVLLKNVQFRVKSVPVLYLPYLYYPIESDDRATGFLMPVYSVSGSKGQGFSNAFFWAIDRSQDATINYDWFSKAGQGVGTEYRYQAAPGSFGNGRVYLLDQKEQLNSDGSVAVEAGLKYQLTGTINQSVGRSFRLIGWSNYFSDIASQRRYQQNVADFTNRNRDVGFTLSGTVKRRLRINARVSQSEVYTGPVPVGQSVLPQVGLWLSDRDLFKKGSQIYFGATGEVVHFDSRNPARLQPEVGVSRFDGTGTLRAPVSRLSWLNVATTAAWHVTQWLDSLDPVTGLTAPIPITRSLFDVGADVTGPVLERTFKTPDNHYAERFRHSIEPGVSVHYLSPFTQANQVIRMDSVDQLVGGTMTLSYGLVNRISANVRRPGGGTQNREVLRVNIGQSYYTNAAAAAVDPQYPPGIVGSFSPVQLQVQFRPTAEVSGRFQMNIDPTAKAPQSYSATTGIVKARLQLFAGWSKSQYLPNIPGFNNPAAVRHALNASATVNTLDGRAGGTYNFNLDVHNHRLIQQQITAYYHAQCCGVAANYQITDLVGLPADRRLSISFTLAGIGTFAPPLGGFGR